RGGHAQARLAGAGGGSGEPGRAAAHQGGVRPAGHPQPREGAGRLRRRGARRLPHRVDTRSCRSCDRVMGPQRLPIRCGPDKVEELHFSLAPVELCPIALTGYVPPDVPCFPEECPCLSVRLVGVTGTIITMRTVSERGLWQG